MEDNVLMQYDVPEDNFHYGKPFVYYKDGDLYLEHFKVLEHDIESVLRAVREYKHPEKTSTDFYQQDLFKKHSNAYDFWFVYFTYQAIGGGLVLWHDIQEVWNEELARRGEHRCPKCQTKTVMYCKPICPACNEVSKYKGAINHFEVAYKLAYKHGVSDYHEYIDAFMNNSEDFRNDGICETYIPEDGDPDEIQRLKEINAEYNFDKYAFWVSW
jgi:hypothetical protein